VTRHSLLAKHNMQRQFINIVRQKNDAKPAKEK